MIEWDYIVVGAGSAGCVVAEQLSRNPGNRVLVLEAGGDDSSAILRIPMAVALCDIKKFDWGFRSDPDPTRAGKSENWTRGRVLGGSSSINGMNYVRGSPMDYLRWEAAGNRGWGPADVWPLFEQLERRDPESFERSAVGLMTVGPLHIRQVRNPHPMVRAFLDAAQSVGYPSTSDYNGNTQEGIGLCQLNQRGRRRWSAADAFLKPALARGNLRLILRAHAGTIIFAGNNAIGVAYEYDGKPTEARARRIVLCAGAINTPALLMLSGIGDPTALAPHGIRTRVVRKDVGRNLMEHPIVRLVYRMKAPTYNLTEGLMQKVRLLAQYVQNGQGPLAAAFEALGFLRTRAEESLPDIQLHIAAMGFGEGLEGTSHNQKGAMRFPMAIFPSMTILVNKNYPKSRGSVTLASNAPMQMPRIQPRLLDSDEDVDTLARGIQLVRRIMSANPMQEFVSEEVVPGSRHSQIDELAVYVRDHAEIAYHPSGTCRMGTDGEAIVGPDLRVKGVENLWIADASVMPDLISGNINAACMMIGMQLGRFLEGS